MRRLIATVASVVFLTVTSGALAGIYAGPMKWFAGEGAGTSYSSIWLENYFSTYGFGYDKTVTFIDNRSYSWHNTVRNRRGTTVTYPPYPGTYKGHCVANQSGFYGSCTIH